jgi:hypothetical protein
MLVHYPDKNRFEETISLCGESILKVRKGFYGSYIGVPKQDSSRVTTNLNFVNCIKCLENLLIKENNRLSIIANRILELEQEKKNG